MRSTPRPPLTPAAYQAGWAAFLLDVAQGLPTARGTVALVAEAVYVEAVLTETGRCPQRTAATEGGAHA